MQTNLGESTAQGGCFGLWGRARHGKQRRSCYRINIFSLSRKDQRSEFGLGGFFLCDTHTQNRFSNDSKFKQNAVAYRYNFMLCSNLFSSARTHCCWLYLASEIKVSTSYITHYCIPQDKHIWCTLTEAHLSPYSQCSSSVKSNK